MALFCFLALIVLVRIPGPEAELELALDSSVPYIDTGGHGYDGEGIIIGIIDTGVDYTHPDLGSGDGKVIKSHNFFGDGDAIDMNGHGTEVAGIIAADGGLQGVAPKAKIISYKVSDDGESVSSDLIIRAIEQAVEDGVDIINISLGVNRTNSKIDLAVGRAVEQGIVVVAAAGNDGPGNGTIGSPGINQRAITVGATYNNLTSSLAATLEIGNGRYQVIPMIGTQPAELPVTGSVAFGGYGRVRDFAGGGFEDAIVLAERGSDVEGEIVYFSDKERNAADAGAVALIVYNNEPGIYLGELVHEFVGEDYYPRIPTVSISREEGLEISNIYEEAAMRIFYNPDAVAHYSSRGPVSPFYIKPDLVAPGTFINTTLNDGGYNLTSGTSFAAPHVSGAAALLLQKNPGLTPEEIKSVLVSTADPVYDAYGAGLGFETAGAGRLNVTRAFDANLVITPPFLTFELSEGDRISGERFEPRTIDGNAANYTVSFDVPAGIRMEHRRDAGMVYAEVPAGVFGEFGGRIMVADGHTSYAVPVIIRSTYGAVSAYETDGGIGFEIAGPEEWTYAKVTITDARTGRTDATSVRPYEAPGEFPVYDNGTYWIEAVIETGSGSLEAYSKVLVGAAREDDRPFGGFDVPQRQVTIVAAIAAVIAGAGMVLRRR